MMIFNSIVYKYDVYTQEMKLHYFDFDDTGRAVYAGIEVIQFNTDKVIDVGENIVFACSISLPETEIIKDTVDFFHYSGTAPKLNRIDGKKFEWGKFWNHG